MDNSGEYGNRKGIKMDNCKTIIIIVVALFILCSCVILAFIFLGGLSFGTAFGLTAPATNQADSFMKALSNSDYTSAYDLCSPELMRDLVSAQHLEQVIEENHLRPKSWKFNSRNVENDQAQMKGTFVASQKGELEINLKKIDGIWKVTGFNLHSGK